MKIQYVKIGKRTFALAFTLDAMATMTDMIQDFDLSQVATYARTPRGLGDLVYCLAQQGELLEGRSIDVDRAWIGAHLSPAPAKAAKVQIAVLTALADGLNMETDDEEKGEVDEVLEEIKKKGTPGASPSEP